MPNVRRYKLENSRTYAAVRSNVYCIPERLREIDKGYFVLYNSTKEVYEVHNQNNIGSTYCFTVPYSQLDYRTLEYCRQSSIQRADQYKKEIEIENEKREKSNAREDKRNLEDRIRESVPLFQKMACDAGL